MNLHVELQFHKLAVVLYGRALSLVVLIMLAMILDVRTRVS